MSTPNIPEPAEPVIPDRPAKLLWVVLTLIAVSAYPLATLTVIDWANWSETIAGQVAGLISGWAGSIGVVLGLSRYARTTPKGAE
ncbi:hypothetical protein SK224_05590 [Microbacterium sp. BG28]|uniref:hypothetical protein n=1 Tax=Microbacterium sp. BG28 TaxID=3097356 RepID=UPI002A59D40F|nr:hypothetical protein [Microbacterium sp. BG28]MDY0828597.1 hypothetical protein [Microbacterium sp. BG28]